MRHYLRLKFTDAGLILNNKASRPLKGYTHINNEFGVYETIKARGIDCETPIGVSQISNMLHVMLGLAPKPTYRRSFIKRNEEIYEIAKTARILYYNDCDKDIYEKSEVIQGTKASWNSHASPKTKIGDTLYSGFYKWSYFLKRFEQFDKIYLEKILSLFNSVLECKDVTKEYMFNEFIIEFNKHCNDKKVLDFLEENTIYLADRGGILKSPMGHLIFRHLPSPPTGNNTTINDATPLLESKEVSKRKVKLSGEIIVEFDDDIIVDILNECGILPTLLDGGIVTVMSLTDELPFTETYYKLKYREIFEQKVNVDSDNQ